MLANVIDFVIILMCLYFRIEMTRFSVWVMAVLSILVVCMLFLYVLVGVKHAHPAKPGNTAAAAIAAATADASGGAENSEMVKKNKDCVAMYERFLSPTALWGVFIAGIWFLTVVSIFREYIVSEAVADMLQIYLPLSIREASEHTNTFLPLCMLFAMGLWRIVHHKCFMPHTQPVQQALQDRTAMSPITEKMASHYKDITVHLLEKMLDVNEKVEVSAEKFKGRYQTSCNDTQKNVVKGVEVAVNAARDAAANGVCAIASGACGSVSHCFKKMKNGLGSAAEAIGNAEATTAADTGGAEWKGDSTLGKRPAEDENDIGGTAALGKRTVNGASKNSDSASKRRRSSAMN